MGTVIIFIPFEKQETRELILLSMTLLAVFDLIGTIAFAISGAFIGINNKMDFFGVNVLAVTTACGGGMMRDLVVSSNPPQMFQNPFYVFIALIVANTVFLFMYRHRHLPKGIAPFSNRMLLGFDTLGLAAFTVDGVMVGIHSGFNSNGFLLCFLGFVTGVGGGILRDIMANQMPVIFREHVYALASIAGGLVMIILLRITLSQRISIVGGFLTVIIIRILASHFRWNLPKVT